MSESVDLQRNVWENDSYFYNPPSMQRDYYFQGERGDDVRPVRDDD